MSLKAKIEAVLYMTDKPLRAQAIAGIVGEELQVVRATLLDLIHEYEERQGGLEIADEDGYSFQVRDQFANLMDQFMPIEMTAALLRTLSAIAIKQPIPQSEIIRIRGAGAYEHIKELVIRGLVSKREDEKTRSPLLSTTKQFQEYFRLTKDGKSLRQYLKREMKKKGKDDRPADSDLLESASTSLAEATGAFAEALGSSVGAQPETVGSHADIAGSHPETAGSHPETTGSVPETKGSILETTGSLDEVNLTSLSAADSVVKGEETLSFVPENDSIDMSVESAVQNQVRMDESDALDAQPSAQESSISETQNVASLGSVHASETVDSTTTEYSS